jgi:hypothetical protein
MGAENSTRSKGLCSYALLPVLRREVRPSDVRFFLRDTDGWARFFDCCARAGALARTRGLRLFPRLVETVARV